MRRRNRNRSRVTLPKDNAALDIKHSKYALGKNSENLTAGQKAKPELIAKTDNHLWRAYRLKEELHTVFRLDGMPGKNRLTIRSNGYSVLGSRLLWNSRGKYGGIMGQSWQHFSAGCQTHGLKRQTTRSSCPSVWHMVSETWPIWLTWSCYAVRN